MANPPPVPLQERLLRTVQTLQFAWFCGHLSMIFFTLRYSLYWLTLKSNTKWALVSYRVAFFSTLATYCIVVYKGYRARQRQGKPASALALMTDENVQYLRK
jgi:transmembrane protein 33